MGHFDLNLYLNAFEFSWKIFCLLPSSSSSWVEFSLISKLSSHPARPTRPDRKSKFLGNWSSCTVFFLFIWNQRCYNNGRPLILKLVPNHEEWDDKLAWFSWKWQRKSMLKWNVTVLCFLYKLIRAHKLGLSCAQLSRSCSRTFLPSSVYLQLQLDWD